MSKKVIIIGGGIGGLSAAYFLQRSGAAVTVIDKGSLHESASIGNAGFLSMFEKSPMAYPGVFFDTLRAFLNNRSPMVINSIFDWQLARWGYQFARATSRQRYNRTLAVLEHFGEEVFSFYKNLTEVDGLDVEYHRDGFALIFTDKKTYQKKISSLPAGSSHHSVLAAEDIKRLFPLVRPDSVAGAILLKRNGHLNPGRVISGLHTLLESQGVVFKLHEEITRIETDNSTVIRAHSASTAYEADEYILASGANLALTKKLQRDFIITPGRGYSITFTLDNTLKPQIPALFCDIYTALTPRREDLRITGKIEFGKSRSSPERRIHELVQVLKNYTQDFSISNETIWTGDRPLTGSDMPYLGRDQIFSNLSYIMGLGHTGINIGPICGRIISELITNDLHNIQHKDLLNLSHFYQG